MEKRIQDELETIKGIIIKTVPVAKIYLFGSYAAGVPNADSDLDLYVVMPESSDIREIDAMRLIHRAIRDKKTMPVDIVVGKENIFNKRKIAPTIERTIMEEGVVLYGQ
ncbi:nucleotidyltransferase domain-containing protein [Desulfosporosinus nitroreducens]|uniref:nucleotidyltransferase domain-containing protein n=1 Tax=Desulfosporosinus nitroreducens TaxID=2018668 RepID=UPI00207C9014|nr:nucleotidyltransferase domain-containing protein [Desulfosporosinus nitroreducens]MCO1604317.1 nucleotidyltransferase domain-containing protein [Desulfosporosinus nitroreducens]